MRAELLENLRKFAAIKTFRFVTIGSPRDLCMKVAAIHMEPELLLLVFTKQNYCS